MSNFYKIDFACQLVTSQECDTIHLFDATRQRKIGHITGTPAECAGELLEYYENTTGPFWVEAFKARMARGNPGEHSRGAKSFKDRPLEFMVGERHRGARDGYDYADNRHDRRKDDEDEEEEEELEAPAVQPFISDEVGKELLGIFKQWMGAKMGGAPAQGITGPAPTTSNPAGNPERSYSQQEKLSDEQLAYMRRVGKAMARMARANPDDFANYSQMLLNMYPDGNQQPKADNPA